MGKYSSRSDLSFISVFKSQTNVDVLVMEVFFFFPSPAPNRFPS